MVPATGLWDHMLYIKPTEWYLVGNANCHRYCSFSLSPRAFESSTQQCRYQALLGATG